MLEVKRSHLSILYKSNIILISRCFTGMWFWDFVSQGISGSIVSGYCLDDGAIEVRSPAGEKDFSSILCIQTGCGAHPASCTMGTGGPFPGGKARLGRDADHSPPSSAEVENE
jgi:hypothetical protein